LAALKRFSHLLRIRSAFKIPMANTLEGRMGEEPPENSQQGEFDVVLLHRATADGEGAHVLRARPGRIEAGEVRPMPEGRPLTPGGEVVRLERRKDAPALFDVHVECKVPAASGTLARTTTAGGPPQVATQAYRESWSRIFGGGRRDSVN
jgi:hypothetical protein